MNYILLSVIFVLILYILYYEVRSRIRINLVNSQGTLGFFWPMEKNSDDPLFNIPPHSYYRPSAIAVEAFANRKNHIPLNEQKKLEDSVPAFFSFIEDNLKLIKSRENIEFEIGKSYGIINHLKFMMNLVVSSTRSFLHWDVTDAEIPIGVYEEDIDAHLRSERNLLAWFIKFFADGKLLVLKPSWLFNIIFLLAFWFAKKLFLWNSGKWLEFLEMSHLKQHVKRFLDQLDLYIFSIPEDYLAGLSSVNGESIFVFMGLCMTDLLWVMQHEMVHSFFRFVQFKGNKPVGKDTVLGLSPLRIRKLQFNKIPVHSGYLYNYLFSGRKMNPRDIKPFSLNCINKMSV